ncbi:hypothetical protein HYX06_00950 [Candidatus Woesearchaeota archaeon]|nr:hypothetical protein [Candidatus Woesearchaeota archaeon]
MASKKVVDYIRGLLQKGYDISTIKNTMLKYGYSSQDISEAVNEIYHPTIRHEIHLGKTTIFALIFIVLSVAGTISFFYYNPPKAPSNLLDLSLKPVKTSAEAGQIISFIQELSNKGSSNRFDVVVRQEVIDSRTFKIVTSKSESRAIETFTTTPAEIVIPEDTPAGDYILRVIAEYDGKKAPATLPVKVLPARKLGCFDGIKNQNEASTDCGGICRPCETQSQECDDQNQCTEDILEDEKCANKPIEPCCGNSLCEFDETEESCSADCGAILEISTSSLDEIKNIALANPSKALQECGKIEIPDLRDTCISSIGEAQKDKEYCARIQGERIKDLCYANIAKLSNDNSICQNILFAPRRDACYMNFMIDNEDYTVCEKLTDSNSRYQCESLRQLHQVSQG